MLVEKFSYKRWADLRTLEAIDCIDKTEYFKSFTFVVQQTNHLLIIEELFKARLLNEALPHENTNSVIVPEFSQLKQRLSVSYDWYLSFVSNLDEEGKQEKVSFIFADGKRGSMTVSEILFHVVNHGSYHRGAISHALDLAQVAHPVDGYAIYIHEKEPQRRK